MLTTVFISLVSGELRPFLLGGNSHSLSAPYSLFSQLQMLFPGTSHSKARMSTRCPESSTQCHGFRDRNSDCYVIKLQQLAKGPLIDVNYTACEDLQKQLYSSLLLCRIRSCYVRNLISIRSLFFYLNFFLVDLWYSGWNNLCKDRLQFCNEYKCQMVIVKPTVRDVLQVNGCTFVLFG